MENHAKACPQCGALTVGRFCSECGSSVSDAKCPNCSASLTAGVRFCANCGATVGSSRRRWAGFPWVITGVTVVAMIVIAIVFGRSPSLPAGGQTAAPTSGAPPDARGTEAVDFANLTPRQRADQFFDHIMRADERGDTAQVMVFRPMALAAYGELDELDGDARFHVGLIEALSGGLDAALAQADSLDEAAPGHLFASNIRHTVAEKRGDVAAAQQAYQAFLDDYEREMAAQRPEYAAHQGLLESFFARAREAQRTPAP